MPALKFWSAAWRNLNPSHVSIPGDNAGAGAVSAGDAGTDEVLNVDEPEQNINRGVVEDARNDGSMNDGSNMKAAANGAASALATPATAASSGSPSETPANATRSAPHPPDFGAHGLGRPPGFEAVSGGRVCEDGGSAPALYGDPSDGGSGSGSAGPGAKGVNGEETSGEETSNAGGTFKVLEALYDRGGTDLEKLSFKDAVRAVSDPSRNRFLAVDCLTDLIFRRLENFRVHSPSAALSNAREISSSVVRFEAPLGQSRLSAPTPTSPSATASQNGCVSARSLGMESEASEPSAFPLSEVGDETSINPNPDPISLSLGAGLSPVSSPLPSPVSSQLRALAGDKSRQHGAGLNSRILDGLFAMMDEEQVSLDESVAFFTAILKAVAVLNSVSGLRRVLDFFKRSTTKALENARDILLISVPNPTPRPTDANKDLNKSTVKIDASSEDEEGQADDQDEQAASVDPRTRFLRSMLSVRVRGIDDDASPGASTCGVPLHQKLPPQNLRPQIVEQLSRLIRWFSLRPDAFRHGGRRAPLSFAAAAGAGDGFGKAGNELLSRADLASCELALSYLRSLRSLTPGAYSSQNPPDLQGQTFKATPMSLVPDLKPWPFSAPELKPLVVFSPGHHCYGVMIKGTVSPSEVKFLWNHLRCFCEVPPDNVCFGSALDNLVRLGQIEDGMCLFEQMKTELEPNTIMYSTLIKGFARERNCERALELFDEMVERDVPMNTVTYNALVNACARAGAIQDALRIYNIMVAKGLEPDIVTYSTLLKAFCTRGDVERGYELFLGLKRLGTAPDGILYNTLLDGCVRARNYALCDAVWNSMQADEVAPSNFTLTIFIKMLGHMGNLNKVFEICSQFPSKYKFEINGHVYTCLMSALISNRCCTHLMQVFLAQLAQIHRLGLPDAKSFETILSGLYKARLLSDGIKILRLALGLSDELIREAIAANREAIEAGTHLLDLSRAPTNLYSTSDINDTGDDGENDHDGHKDEYEHFAENENSHGAKTSERESFASFLQPELAQRISVAVLGFWSTALAQDYPHETRLIEALNAASVASARSRMQSFTPRRESRRSFEFQNQTQQTHSQNGTAKFEGSTGTNWRRSYHKGEVWHQSANDAVNPHFTRHPPRPDVSHSNASNTHQRTSATNVMNPMNNMISHASLSYPRHPKSRSDLNIFVPNRRWEGPKEPRGGDKDGKVDKESRAYWGRASGKRW